MTRIQNGLMACLFLPMLAAATVPETPVSLEQQAGLVFRFTGLEAQRLKDYLKVRMPEAKDSRVEYYGDKASLACSIKDDCYLYLSKKEWKASSNTSEATLAFDFTLPLHQVILQGQLLITPPAPVATNSFQLRLTDSGSREDFSFQKALDCPILTEWTEDYLKGDGDCRLEFTAEKKGLAYRPSMLYVQNSDNVASVLRGPWAEKLFKSGGPIEVEPNKPTIGRVMLGNQFYCWDLDLPGQELTVDERYFCQSKHLPVDASGREFIVQGSSTQGENHALILRPRFEQSLLQGFDLSYKSGQEEIKLDYCPYERQEGDPSRCSFALNYQRDVIYYPLWKPVQGVAVGWGVAPETPATD